MNASDSSRREAVLESALATFARFGYRKTSMEQVAQDARISRPGLYFLFASKEALFQAAVAQTLERDLAAVERLLTDPAHPLPERLLEAFDQWAGRYLGPLAREVTVVIDDNSDLTPAIAKSAPRRFEKLVTAAIAPTATPETAPRLAQTLISTSIGLKHQVTTRAAYRQRLATAISLLLR